MYQWRLVHRHPCGVDDEHADEPNSELGGRGGGQKRILIVSADPREARVLMVSLKRAGLDVQTCVDGFEALELLDVEGDSYALALIELNLSPMDGFELAERIRNDAALDRLGLLALSGSKDLASKLHAFEVGFDELLHKPLFAKELLARIELHLQRRAMEAIAEAEAEEIEGSIDDVSAFDLVQMVLDTGKSGGCASSIQMA
jgi:DNA-binding response OmpR family regulator